MAKNVTVTLDTKILDRIIKNLGDNVAEAVAKVALTVEGKAKMKAPVDTGALRASIYTSLKRGGGEAAIAKAKSLNPAAETVALPTPNNDHTAYVGPSVEYGAAVELGSSRRGATPYLVPAVRETEREFRERLGKAVTDGQ